ncbi:MAG: hypothetical protein ACLP0J_09400 [Solirubrobacteraceae bacterium]|jgi:hypothetical protein
MATHRTRRRAALIALLSAVALLTTTVAGAAAGTTTTAPAPHLGLSWTVIEHQCWTATRRVRARIDKKIKIEKRYVRRCGDRPAKAHGRALHLAWRHHGEVFGHLTLARQPIANATINITWTVPGSNSGGETVTTNAEGRFSALIHGPCALVTITYQQPGGTVITITKQVLAHAFLSLHIGHLEASHRARFSGVVAGGYIPTDGVYVQFWYLDGSAGWQPFSNLALATAPTGRWATNVPIPAYAAGYQYQIKATVVNSPKWPWAHTDSQILTRYVSY